MLYHILFPARLYASVGIRYGSVSVCVSVTSRYCIEMAAQIEPVVGTQTSFDLSSTLFLKIRASLK